MFREAFRTTSVVKVSLILAFVPTLFIGCSVAAKDAGPQAESVSATTAPVSKAAPASKGKLPAAGIEIKANSPADAVKTFYSLLRERKFREAMMMTNIRAAVEGLTDAEMEDLKADFEPLALQVPAEVVINGEIVTGKTAVVKTKMPNNDTGQMELTEIKLRNEGDVWVVLTADDRTEEAVKKEGKNYFFALKMDVHHVEAQRMIERIVKAQAIHALQHNGVFADMATLLNLGYLPEDIMSSVSTGYNFTLVVSADKKKYFATAEPAVYGKTGRTSFLAECEGPDKKASLKAEDRKGAPLRR